MTPSERWTVVANLFDAALERPADERAAWVRATCRAPDLQDEVLQLLAAHRRNGNFLERPALDLMAEWDEGATVEQDREREVGPYRLVRLLGQGGMGRVYLAERNDGQFDQRVALKVLRREVYDERFLRRFLAERQILASLNHPNIARLFDGGRTADGTPYFVLEYVNGQPIDAYCRANTCTVHERLTLFRAACRAVQYAHQNLVVHRDLKPSNILVARDGTVKLLDFGIARLVDSASSPQRTRGTHRWMTPDYASPEQVRGEGIATASDVYQLGVVLYELLAGQRPFDVRDERPGTVARIICEAAPPRPSATPGLEKKRRHALRGDLDTIVLKALRKEPDRRYASVEAFVDDLERYRTGRPVAARPDTWRYRSRKFVTRHRQGVATVVAVILLVVSLGVAYMHRVAQERNKAQLEAQKSARVTAFMTELLQEFDPSASSGGMIAAEAVLDRAVERLRRELSDQPAVQARLLNQIGQIHQSYGRYDKAESLIKAALEQQKQLFGPRHPNVARSMEDMAWVLCVQGDYDIAERYYRRALALQRALFGEHHVDVASSLAGLGVLLHIKGRDEAAEPLLRDALRLRRQLLSAQHPEIASSLSSLAYLLYTRYQYDEAERLYREALSIRRATLGTHVRVASTLHNLAALLVARQHDAQAEAMYREALAMRRDLLGNAHPHIAQSLSHLGLLLTRRGSYHRAERLFEEALAIRRQHWGEEHVTVANSLNLLGWARFKQGAHAQGETDLRRAIALYRTLLGADHAYVASGLTKLGALLTADSQYAEAERVFRQALAIVQALPDAPPPRRASVLAGMGALHVRRDEPSQAEPLLREALSIRRVALGPNHRQTVDAQAHLGECLTALRHFEEAETLLLASHEALNRRTAATAPGDRKRVRDLLATLYTVWDRPEQAARYRASASDSSAVAVRTTAMR